MNIGIVGGRNFNDYDLLKKTLDAYIENKSFLTAIVSGGATGADTLAEKYAQELGVEMIVYRPDYKNLVVVLLWLVIHKLLNIRM